MRYTTKGYIADECFFEDREPSKTLTVEDCLAPIDTGLIDCNENKIYRVREPIGFLQGG